MSDLVQVAIINLIGLMFVAYLQFLTKKKVSSTEKKIASTEVTVDKVHELVNGRSTAMQETIDRLQEENQRLQAALSNRRKEDNEIQS